MTDATPVLAIRDLSKTFGALVANDAISLTVNAGEIHALIGPNGAGKSTLIKQITGEVSPDAGTIRFGQHDVTAMPRAERARAGLATTFQISALMTDFTALQNAVLAVAGRKRVVFGFLKPALSDPALVEPARAALARLELAERADVPVKALSHGERRRLEVALALCMEPQILLMDEPMAGLGPEGSAALTTILADLGKSVPILLIEHDMDAVFTLADRITVLVYGRVIATGTPDEIRANRDVQEAYLGEDA